MLAHSTGHYAAGTNPALLRSNSLESINSSVYMNPDKFPDAQDPNWKPADSCSPTQREDTPMKGGMALIPVPKSTPAKRLSSAKPAYACCYACCYACRHTSTARD